MRKIRHLLMMVLVVVLVVPTTLWAKVNHEEVRGAWIATVFNIDYPTVGATGNQAQQQKEYIELLDQLQAIGINTVYVQVRPKGDAFYKSQINPWSDILTGVQGQDPGYDPMAFMIEETHKRGMSFHAWLNPYRVTTSGTDLSQLAANHPARLNPEWLITHSDKLYYNPALEAVQQHIADTVAEIVMRYDVDGIHFDDYFYPTNYPLPEGETKDGPTANSRREDINNMVKKVSETIRRINKDVQFGISPIGIWKNKVSDSAGSNTTGGEGYYTVCADAKSWIENEWIDYIMPQIYWEIGHKSADYTTLVKWWSNLVKGTNVKLYIGQGIYKDVIASQIADHFVVNAKYDQVEGNVYFSAKDLVNNRQGVADKLTSLYKNLDFELVLPEPEPEAEPETKPEPLPELEEEEGETSSPPTLQPAEPDEATIYKIGTVTGDRLNVRSGAGTQYESMAQLQKGESVKVIDTVGAWYQILLEDGKKGFVSCDYIKLSTDIRLVIDGKQVTPTVAPILQDGVTLVPLRIISENLEAEVKWDGVKQEVTILKGSDRVNVTIGSKTVVANGVTSQLEVAPVLIDASTMVPIRFIGENLGAEIGWQGFEKIVTVTSK